ncbi:MAG: bifunctional (p)ppGpp synthetase/guanosine-3',5'-bis(diphosphate) 3'-pyrophosphohydrolase [Lachnospiraceae bacterium]|nr:bifunctional (p)ppGpp synthetase/guanosine-3',5'-bis(diphosphate) 3'-pyrophosphohydrolase [Lachnospiraceae bacterium]
MSEENRYIDVEELSQEHAELISTTDFESPDQLYDRLVNRIRKYHPSDDLSLIEKAYEVAKKAHGGQLRKSGEPYIIHPLCVALILADLELDKETIIGGLLHDVVEDTEVTDPQIAEEFGDEVALIVDGVTKLGKMSYKADKIEMQAENLRKMFLAMAKDIRVIMIKLADRLHNMRTLRFMPVEKQKEKARETMDIYSPIAQRLGISKIKIELDDLALKYLEPEVYYDLAEKIASNRHEREDYVRRLMGHIKECMDKGEIKCEVSGRVKHFFSIYKKMVNQHKTLDQIYDLFAIRVIVNDIKDCYAALGLIHEKYTPIPGRFKDYIAMPKQNMYQSLHTTLIGPGGKPFEVQIRTFEMHRNAEYGIAAHWKYKESPGERNIENSEEAKLTWLRKILEWQTDMSDNKEFLSLVKDDLNLFSDSVYCFTPQGDVKSLPQGSTPIDFAYSIHSAVGNKMIGARVNNRLVNIDYVIQNGDRIEIITSQNSKGPSRDWLNIVKSTQAKTKINQWFRSEFKEENINKGKELLQTYCKNKNITLSDIMKPKYIEKVCFKYNLKDWNAVCAAVGHGSLKEGQVINKMVMERSKDIEENITDEDILQKAGVTQNKSRSSKGGIIVKGVNDLAARLSKCCNPVPGDEIVGFITRGRGVTIHRTDCVNIINLSEDDRKRLIEAEWEDSAEADRLYKADINIYVQDKVGVLVAVAKVFTESGINVTSMATRPTKTGTSTINVTFDIGGRAALGKIIDKLRMLDCVIDIQRALG